MKKFLQIIVWKFKHKSTKNIEEIKKQISHMQPREFEIFCSDLYKELGYEVELNSFGNDYGRDIIIETKGKEVICVEFKR